MEFFVSNLNRFIEFNFELYFLINYYVNNSLLTSNNFISLQTIYSLKLSGKYICILLIKAQNYRNSDFLNYYTYNI